MTMLQPTINPQVRYFPSRIALLAAVELVLIALLLRLSNSPAFFAAAIACSLCSIQLGIVLINRFQVSTRRIRQIARQAEYSAQAVLITDGSGKIKWANNRFTRLTGYYLSEISGKTFGMVLHGQETSPQMVEQIRRNMREELPFDVDLQIYNRIGESMWISSRGEAIHDDRGNLTHYVITQADVSEQHRLIHEIVKSATAEKAAISSVDAPTILSLAGDASADRFSKLTKQLETLSLGDDREHLQNLVDSLKQGAEQCVAALPPMAVETVKDQASNQHTQEG